MNEAREKSEKEQPKPLEIDLGCTCVQDPFAVLPPELRPRNRPCHGSLRKVTCPGCGLVYRTNRATDLCPACERRGVKVSVPEEQADSGE
jgi:hypothetical protein